MSKDSLQTGDVIGVDRPGYRHVGLYVAPRWHDRRDVVHNRKGGCVELTTREEFSGGEPIVMHQKAVGNHYERQQMADRAMKLIGTNYDLLNFNCEHMTNLAQRGKRESFQLQVYLFLGFLLFIGAIAWIAGGSRKA